MECHDARQLLALLRREPAQVESAEVEAVERHVELCPACQTWNASEAVFDAAVAKAMRDVAIPAGLKDRVVARLSRSPSSRRVVPWAAAASLLIAVTSLGLFFTLRPEPIQLESFVYQLDDEPTSHPHSVQKYFADLGYPITPPADFDYDLLTSYKPAYFQGRMVPRLTFQVRQRTGDLAVAHVYCLSTGHFQFDEENETFWSSPERRRQITVLRAEGEVYVAVCTGGDLWQFRRGTY